MPLDPTTRIFLEQHVFKGEIVDRYTGRGGLIYIVERSSLPTRVAYKTVQEFEDRPSNGTGRDGIQRIEREAKHWFHFAGHPLVIRPHSVTMVDGYPLICMPYCDGDLSKLMEQKFDLTSVIYLSLQIVEGMIAANSLGMDHHQDIKPQNILFTDLSRQFPGFPPDGVDSAIRYSLRIADFGVANAWHDNHKGGTNASKAPEQHEGADVVGFAPDVFAVGIIIAELLQGHHPAGASAITNVGKWKGSKLKKWAISGVRQFSAANDKDTEELVQLIREMLSPEPGLRPSFRQCSDRLKHLLSRRSSATAAQSDLLFAYFDFVAKYCALEDEIHRMLAAAAISSLYPGLLATMTDRLEYALGETTSSVAMVLRLHHLANGLHRLYGRALTSEGRELLARASQAVVAYVACNHNEIKSEHLYPAFEFQASSSKTISDFEARAELFNVSVNRLSEFGLLADDTVCAMKDGVPFAEAALLYSKASEAWVSNDVVTARRLLRKVCKLVPAEPELTRLFEDWGRALPLARTFRSISNKPSSQASVKAV